jgi:hypothetical protein
VNYQNPADASTMGEQEQKQVNGNSGAEPRVETASTKNGYPG